MLTRCLIGLLGWLFFVSAHSLPVLYPINNPAIELASFQGKTLFIHYWASWCDVCLQEIETLNQFYHMAPKEVVMFAINVDNLSEKEQQALAKQYHLALPLLRQEQRPPFNADALAALPALIIWSAQGELKGPYYGPQTLKTLNNFLKK